MVSILFVFFVRIFATDSSSKYSWRVEQFGRVGARARRRDAKLQRHGLGTAHCALASRRQPTDQHKPHLFW